MAKKEINKDSKKFGKELKSELKTVTWPTFKELVSSTSAVISIVLIVGIIVFVLDVCFENLNKFGVEGLKAVVSSNTEETSDEEVTDESTDTDDSSIDLVDVNSDENTETTNETDSEEVSEEETDTEAGENQ